MKSVTCAQHGERSVAFVCRHLVRGSGLGFFLSDQAQTADECDERCGWCSQCEQVRQQQGGWTDVSEAFAGVTMICNACFEASRKRNEL